jgi:ribose transport system permease protein
MMNRILNYGKKNIESLSRLFAIIIIFLLLFVISPSFGTATNILNMLRVASLNLIIATGVALTMLVGGIDLSPGASIALTTILFGPMFQTGHSPGEMMLGLTGILVLSCVIGAANGLCIVYLGIAPFLATYGVQQITRGLAYLITKGAVFSNFTPAFQVLGAGYFLGIVPWPIIFAGVLLVIIGFLLNKTTLGRRIFAIGSNPDSAYYSGINLNMTLLGTYTLAGLIFGIAGIIYISRLNAAEPSIGSEFAMSAIAAAAIGGISFEGGRGNVFNIMIGALILTFITTGMNLLGINSDWQMGVTGVIIILAVMIDRNTAKKKL